ncbi:hypothetical protein MNAN1_003447 [Malassezia nana]|uniref:Bacterial surface antigen (D15) domain-containing protein n=1 Tax=Malassezia nana TaxID=180528 RepID=A0AAF0EPK0_9BASI|nr:hypothetical protein MNAN1_003447 [Malassezia nana]
MPILQRRKHGLPLGGQPTTIFEIIQSATSLSSDISKMDIVKDITVQLEPAQHPVQHAAEEVDVLAFTTPVFASPDIWANISSISQHRDLTNFISAHEGQHVLRSALMYSAPDGTRHELAYEASHRHFHHILPEASVAIRRLAKPSFKSAISYTIERDTRDNSFITMVGSYFKSVLEYAGLGGDTSYIKSETQASLSNTFAEHWLHAFTNMGQLMQVQPRTFVPLTPDAPVGLSSFHELLQPSASMGVGLLFQQGPVRLELNFGLPLCVRAGDGSRKGLQFGIGLEFL